MIIANKKRHFNKFKLSSSKRIKLNILSNTINFVGISFEFKTLPWMFKCTLKNFKKCCSNLLKIRKRRSKMN